jgi:hypothetical protein
VFLKYGAEFYSLCSLGTDLKENTFAHQRVLGTDPKEKATPLLCRCPTPKKTPPLHSNCRPSPSNTHTNPTPKKTPPLHSNCRPSPSSARTNPASQIRFYIDRLNLPNHHHLSSTMIISVLPQQLVLLVTAEMNNTDLKENMHMPYMYVVSGINNTNYMFLN